MLLQLRRGHGGLPNVLRISVETKRKKKIANKKGRG